MTNFDSDKFWKHFVLQNTPGYKKKYTCFLCDKEHDEKHLAKECVQRCIQRDNTETCTHQWNYLYGVRDEDAALIKQCTSCNKEIYFTIPALDEAQIAAVFGDTIKPKSTEKKWLKEIFEDERRD